MLDWQTILIDSGILTNFWFLFNNTEYEKCILINWAYSGCIIMKTHVCQESSIKEAEHTWHVLFSVNEKDSEIQIDSFRAINLKCTRWSYTFRIEQISTLTNKIRVTLRRSSNKCYVIACLTQSKKALMLYLLKHSTFCFKI